MLLEWNELHVRFDHLETKRRWLFFLTFDPGYLHY